MKRRYAKDTQVAVAKSRGEIDRLLRQWGADAIQWTDEFSADRATLRFLWRHDEVDYMARFAIRIEPVSEDDVVDGRTGRESLAKREKAEADRGKREYRVLLLWLRATLNAVDSGIVDAATVFLPFLEDKTGITVAEFAVPNLAKLATGRVKALLPSAPKP